MEIVEDPPGGTFVADTDCKNVVTKLKIPVFSVKSLPKV